MKANLFASPYKRRTPLAWLLISSVSLLHKLLVAVIAGNRSTLQGFVLAVLTLASVHTQAQVRVFTDLQAFNEAVLRTAEVFVTDAANIAKADEQSTAPGRNRGVGAVQNPGTRTLTFDRTNTGLDFDFEFTALKSELLTFDDDEGNGNLPNFDNALSPGDIDNTEDDDWSVRVTAPTNRLRAFGFFLQDNNGTAGETIQVYTSIGQLVDEVAVPGSLPTNTFIGVVSSIPFAEIRYDEGVGGDDIAVKDFRFVQDRTPEAFNVFAATPVNTAASPQSASIFLEGSDFLTGQTMRYRILSMPSHGALTDSGGLAIKVSGIVSNEVIYTPDPGFAGIDTFDFQAFASNQFFGRSGTTATARITVFDALRPTALQLGDDIDGEATGDLSGEAIALSRDAMTLAVGARLNDGNGSSAGQARVFRRDGAQWTQLGLDLDGSFPQDEFGTAVALSAQGDTLAVGASQDSNAVAGYVRVFELVGENWEVLGDAISAHNGLDSDESVTSVSLSTDGRTVALGLSDRVELRGRVRVFRWNDNAWVQLGQTLIGEAAGDRAGDAIALSSNGLTVAIGAPFNDGASGNTANAGHVRVYRFIEGAWQKLGDDIDEADAFSLSGSAVSLSSDGDLVAIGAPRKSTTAGDFSGQVRVYRWNNLEWETLGAAIDGSGESDEFGQAVSLSSDGRTLSMGAVQRGFAGGTPGEGYARVVRWSGTGWEPVGGDIVGDAINDDFGNAALLSGDGQTLVVGAPGHGPSNRGHARVFDLSLSIDDDDDADGVTNGEDDCDNTPASEVEDINADGCGPSERDSDGDGVNDRDDLFPADPLDFADSDGDGLGDNREEQLGTNPQLVDTDGDGFTDFDEVEAETDPTSSRDAPSAPGLNIILIKAAIDT